MTNLNNAHNATQRNIKKGYVTMRALAYEIKAYEKGYNESKSPTKWKMEHTIGCGSGKRAKAKAIKQANEMWYTGKYEAVFVDALNQEEIIDDECVNIPTV